MSRARLAIVVRALVAFGALGARPRRRRRSGR